MTALVAVAGIAEAAPNAAEVKAALVRCADVTYPAAVSGCGADPLSEGRIEVRKDGDLRTLVTGAEPNVTYDVLLHGTNGSTPLAVLATDAQGNGSGQWNGAFDVGQAGIVALTLSRNGSTQFVAGFNSDDELEAGLLPCGAVNTPATLTGCGADELRNGSVEIDDGEVEIEVSRAAASATYDAVLRSFDGATNEPLGTLTTNARGDGKLEFDLPDGVVGAGNVVLQRDGLDQFITGFQSMRKRAPNVARFQVGLLRCSEVNVVAALTDCGVDQLRKGSAIIDGKGDVNVHVMGAVALSTYEVVFVGFDGTTEVPVGTLTTNPAGNGSVIVRDVFDVDSRGVGQIILKREGVDQFVTGFSVSR